MKETENKEYKVSARLNEEQHKVLQDIVDSGKAKTTGKALQYLLSQYSILGK
ncbi:TPA: hypothetical protein ACPYV3_002829 [Citrobacter freundii]|uniref:Uncharacterized protein n=1 Tax=Citrobacter freundii TaxID=546 RepID=A0AAD2SDT9_CITFR|nr:MULTISPECIES: hypothetical protein [Citrobacter]EJG2170966.1 hypothetical protein [Citrobacter freundii 47N]HCT9712067.1 hypothetical protein [Citrobacter werkmanii]EKT9386386.1 hypothetical protein [Citrobacter freundii]EKU1806931.1 hypothetical protein [Citrobacter freundii]EKU8473143.1 hypothetical protein [Citrobacter freundii]